MQGQVKGRASQVPVRDAKMSLEQLKIWYYLFSLHTRKNLSENYPQSRHAPSKSLASPILGQKGLNNIGFKWRKIISLPGAPTCLGPVLTP
jgi:hypothetical protein